MLARELEEPSALRLFHFMDTLAEFIAGNRDRRKTFSKLHADYLEQQRNEMTSTTSTLNADLNQNQAADGRSSTERSAAARQFATTLQPGSKSPAQTDQATDGTGAESVTGVPVINVKPVDRRTLQGSTPGDFRAPASTSDITAFAKDAPGPRDAVGQFPLSGKQAAASAPVTFIGAEGSDQN